MVSAWGTANGVTLGQVSALGGSSEVAVIPDMLRTLDLAGAVVTTDAAGCQTQNARLIRGQDSHDLLAVTDHQPELRAAVGAVFDRACDADFAGVRRDGHGPPKTPTAGTRSGT